MADGAMPGVLAGVLMSPDNRLLAWSTNDLALYGGMPTVTIGLARPAFSTGSYVSVVSFGSSPSPAHDSDDDHTLESLIPTSTVAAPVAADLTAGTGAAAPASAASATTPPPSPAVDLPPAVPAPTGSGSLAPLAVASPPAAGDADGDGTADPVSPASIASEVANSSFIAPVLDIANPIVAPTAGTAASLAALTLNQAGEIAAGTLTVAATDIDAIADAVGSVPAITGGLVGDISVTTPIVATIGPILDTTLAATTDTVTTTAAAIDDLAGGAQSVLLPAVDAVTATAAGSATGAALVQTSDVVTGATALAGTATGSVVGQVSDDVAAIGLTAAPVIEDTLAAVVPGAVGAPVGPLDGDFGGTDPVGGVSTLVDMVDSADVFAPATAEVTPLASGGNILDALALDDAPPALLGEAAGQESHAQADGHDDDGGLAGIL